MGALSSLATVGLNLALAQQGSKRQSSSIGAERDQQIRAIQVQDEEVRRQEQERLRRQLAAQRARAAAAGVGRGGSAQAVLRGLIEENEAADQARQERSSTRISEINRDANRAQQRNLLDLVGSATRGGLRTLSGSSQRRSLFDL
jgi:hypothetical protein